MTNPFYFYIHYLEQLCKMLSKANEQDIDGRILTKRIAPDMFPLAQQVATTASFALRAGNAITGYEQREIQPEISTYSELITELQRVITVLKGFTEDCWQNYQNKTINLVAGFNNCTFTGSEYLTLFSQPNFLFHLNMVYAILRANNVSLSKQDYDGFHTYPDHFSFE